MPHWPTGTPAASLSGTGVAAVPQTPAHQLPLARHAAPGSGRGVGGGAGGARPGAGPRTLALVFPLVYLYSLSNQSLVFARYLLPAIPFLCLLIAAAVVSGVSLLRRFDIPRAVRTAIIAGLTVAVLLPPAIQAVGFNRLISRRSTLERGVFVIVENVPQGSTVVVETGRNPLAVSLQVEQHATAARASALPTIDMPAAVPDIPGQRDGKT